MEAKIKVEKNTKLERWYSIRKKLRLLQEEEKKLRQELCEEYFADAKEGTNSFPLDKGYVLQAKIVINRKVDEATLSSVMEELAMIGVSGDPLIRYKPEVNMKEYRRLDDKARTIFDQALTISKGMPQLDIVLPKR